MRFLLFVCCLLGAGTTFAHEPVDRVQVTENRDTLEMHLRVDADQGQVDLADVLRAVARYNGYDDSELTSLLPTGKIALHGRTARWSIAAANRVLRPCVQVRAHAEQLNITVNRESARHWINDCKSDVRWVWDQVDWRSQAPDYGIRIHAEWRDDSDIVVLVHGLNSRPEDLCGFHELVKQAGMACASFRYPNDQPIDESSKLLAAELARLGRAEPNRKIRLLTHSMGGLVARGVIETELDPGNVEQLIMVAPPNHGSGLAPVAVFMDCHEFFTSPDYHRTQVFVESVSDGLGEATADLSPGSVFLDRLNRRPRNPRVVYTILLGTAGPMREEEMSRLRETVRDYTDDTRVMRFVSSKLVHTLDSLDEVVDGKGDGVVSCERGRLAGVRDVVELPFSHASVLGGESAATYYAHQAILDRLEFAR